LEDLASWVDFELNGYPTRDVPEYRKFSGIPRYWNQYHGWQPLGGDSGIIGSLSEVKFGDSIAGIEKFASSKSSSLLSQFPPSILEFLSENLGVPVARAGAEVSVASVVAILDSVRTAILDWSIAMEKAGVHGEGLSFSAVEQQKAQTASTVFHINSIGTFTGNLGVGNTSGDITSAPLNIEKVKTLVSQVKSNASSLVNEGVSEDALMQCISSLEQILKKPNQGLLKKGLEALQTAVLKATGGLVSTGVLTLLHQMLGTGAAGCAVA
jgi:hypothetical protein